MALRMMKKVSLRLKSSKTRTKESKRGLKIPRIASIIVKK
jgi:hypothetical protein